MASTELVYTPALAEAPSSARLVAALARWLDDFEQRRRRRRQLCELRGLGAGALKDLGLDRSELGSVVATGAAGRRRCHDAG